MGKIPFILDIENWNLALSKFRILDKSHSVFLMPLLVTSAIDYYVAKYLAKARNIFEKNCGFAKLSFPRIKHVWLSMNFFQPIRQSVISI